MAEKSAIEKERSIGEMLIFIIRYLIRAPFIYLLEKKPGYREKKKIQVDHHSLEWFGPEKIIKEANAKAKGIKPLNFFEEWLYKLVIEELNNDLEIEKKKF